MLTIFWNAKEKRLRAGWRILIQIIFLLVLSGLISTLIGAALGVYYYVSSGANSLDLNQLGPQINQFISKNLAARLIANSGVLIAMLVSIWLAGRFLDKRRFADFGLHFNRRWWADLGFGMFLGALLMAVVFVAEYALGWVTITSSLTASPNQNLWLALLGGFIFFIYVGIQEEMFSRGYQLLNLGEGLRLGRLSPRTALLLGYLLSSTIFGFLHLGNPNSSWVSTINLIIAGLLLGLGYILTGELGISIGLHITWNFFQGNIFGFPVSGTDAGASLINIQQGGPALWTGGAFGPEAGLLGLAVMLLGMGLIAGWVYLRTGQLTVYTRPAEELTAPK
jgi:membrane protease YdiL (CAAX protease family)